MALPQRRALVIAAVATVILRGDGAAAQSACPSAVVAGKGITLAAPGGRTGEITWLAGGRTRIAEKNPAAPRNFPRETIAERGLVGIDLTRPSGKAKLTFETPLEPIFPLQPGKQHELAYVVDAGSAKPVKARLTLAVLEPLQHALGTCTYEALLVGTVSTFEDGGQTPMRYDVYVPALHAVVKTTMFDATSNRIYEQESFEYQSIAAR